MNVKEEVKAFLAPIYEEVNFYMSNAEKQYNDATEELNTLPDMTEELKNAVWKNNEAEYQKLRRKSDFIDQRRQYLEGIRERYADDANTIPIRPRKEMIQKITTNFWTQYNLLSEKLYKSLKEVEEIAEAFDLWANSSNNAVNLIWQIGSVSEEAKSVPPLPGQGGFAQSFRNMIAGTFPIADIYRKLSEAEVKRRYAAKPVPADDDADDADDAADDEEIEVSVIE